MLADLAPPDVDARALIARQLAVLTRLADVGLEIAEAAGRRAAREEDQAGPAAPDPALAYARAARAVRMTLALQSRLLADLAALDRAATAETSARAQARRSRIRRLVEHSIETACADVDEAERLGDAAWERLCDADDLGDLLSLPVGEAVARICRELGVTVDAVMAKAFAPDPASWPPLRRADRGPLARSGPPRLPPRAASP